MSIIRSTHQLEGLITLDNVKQIAVFSDFDSAVLFRAHHPAWEVHIHLVLPRAPQTSPTSATVRHQPPLELVTEPVEVNHTQPLRLRQAQASSPHISAYLTDGETIYKQAIFTQEQLGIANDHAQTETDGLLYWEQQPASHIASVLGFKNATCLMEWCERRGITYCAVRHNYLSTRQLATLLGVNVSTIQKWAKKGLLPTHRGYKRDLPVHLFLREEIEHWLMAPMPAWALLPAYKIQDERFRCVMENAQAYNANYWRPIQETADTLYTTRSNLKHHVNKGRIASRMLGGRRWVHYPDAVRVMQGEYG